MLRHEGNFIGDSWYYIEDDTIHCYYLTCPNTVERHTAWDIGHAVSRDLENWTDHHIVIERGAPGDWDDVCLATGSVIKFENRYWMAYTAKWDKPDVAAGLAISDDLFTWKKVGDGPITQIDERFYEKIGSGTRHFSHWRDPQLFAHDGYIYHAICASKNSGPEDARGTVGLARTKDMKDWEIVPPPSVEEVSSELECPQIRPCGNGYMLLFSSFYDLFSAELRNELGKEGLPTSGYAMYSDSIFGPYTFSERKPLIPKDYHCKPYALQYLTFKGQSYVMGTVWEFETKLDFICDPIPVECDGQKISVS